MVDLYVLALVQYFVTIDPIGMAPIFVGLTVGQPLAARRAAAIKGAVTGGAVLLGFALAGDGVLDRLGIGLPALQIAGGVMLFLTAIEMVFGRRTPRRGEAAEKASGETADVAIFPLGVPLIAGPAAITSTLLLTGETMEWAGWGAVVGALVTVVVLTGVTMWLAAGAGRYLPDALSAVLTRVLGLLCGALAVQYVLDGLRASLFA